MSRLNKFWTTVLSIIVIYLIVKFGIPAVVGVHEATERLKDGQRIRLDGATGEIVMIHE